MLSTVVVRGLWDEALRTISLSVSVTLLSLRSFAAVFLPNRIFTVLWPPLVVIRIAVAIFAGVAALLLALHGQRMVLTNDEGIVLESAQRMATGGRIYVDFFGYMSPGSYWLQALVFRLLGVALWTGRLIVILDFALQCALVYWLAARLASWRAAAAVTLSPSGRRSSGRVGLLLQNPNDYLIHERVAEEASAEALEAVGLGAMAERNPRDLSGGERQRLALAIVTGEEESETGRRDGAPAVLALDEPTRGMDRETKAELAAELSRRAASGQAVIVATHDPEFAAACAQRAILLADGRVIADGPASELLAGGWYFATETARILGGAEGALLPEQGAEVLRARAPMEVAL